MTREASDKLTTALSYLMPARLLSDAQQRQAWRRKERASFQVLARFYFVATAIAYIFHLFWVDIPSEKQPIELWVNYRLGLAACCLISYFLYSTKLYARLHWYKLPVALAGLGLGYIQAQTMLWHPGIPYFYAFLIPALSCLLLRWNVVQSVAYLLTCYLLEWPIFVQAMLPTPVLLSAGLVSITAVVVFRMGMLAEIQAFCSEQMRMEMQHSLNSAWHETRKKETDLAAMNDQLLRKNEVFQTLLEASTQLPHFDELSQLLEYSTRQLQELFQNCGFGIIFCEQGSRRIAEASFINIPGEIQRYLMYHNMDIWRDSFETDLHNVIFARNLDNRELYLSDQVRLLAMHGTADRILGKALIVGLPDDKQAINTISLFLALVTSCAESLVLTKRLEHMAHVDKLTSTFNRNYFDLEYKRMLAQKEKYPDLDFSVFLIDVNGLKQVNDDFGHKEGDNLIVKVASLLKSSCRKSDIVARLGGDEFVILCPETKNAAPLLERIRTKEINTKLKCRQENGEAVEFPVRMSIGLASTSKVAASELLKVVDEKMYENKRQYYAQKGLSPR